MKEKLKDFFSDVFSITDQSVTKEEIKERIKSNAKLKGPNMCMLCLAIILASIGLDIDSATVVMGAMLISPLMGVIQGIGYALATTDIKYLKRVFVAFIIEIGLCLITSTLYFSLSPITLASNTSLLMTSSKLWEAIIAFVAGTAGILGITRKEKSSTVLPGVAITTSMIAPLCRAGYGISNLNMNYTLNALYTFFINMFFICLSTVIVLKLLKIPRKRGADKQEERNIKFHLTIIAIIALLPSGVFAYEGINQAVLERNVSNYLTFEFNFESTQIVKSSINKEKNEISVAVIGKVLDKDTIKILTNNLKLYKLDKMSLKITQTEIESGVKQEELEQLKNELAVLKATLASKESKVDNKEKILRNLTDISSKIVDCTITSSSTINVESSGEENVIITVLLADILSSGEIISVENYLAEEFKDMEYETKYSYN